MDQCFHGLHAPIHERRRSRTQRRRDVGALRTGAGRQAPSAQASDPLQIMRSAALSLLFFTSISTVFAAGREIAPARNRPQVAPSVATDGIDFLTTWIESNSPPQTLTAARLTHS